MTQDAAQELERAFGVLAMCGVTRGRARWVANGILVLDQRYAREVEALTIRIGQLERAMELIVEGVIVPGLWSEEERREWTELDLAYRTALVIANVALENAPVPVPEGESHERVQ